MSRATREPQTKATREALNGSSEVALTEYSLDPSLSLSLFRGGEVLYAGNYSARRRLASTPPSKSVEASDEGLAPPPPPPPPPGGGGGEGGASSSPSQSLPTRGAWWLSLWTQVAKNLETRAGERRSASRALLRQGCWARRMARSSCSLQSAARSFAVSACDPSVSEFGKKEFC